MRCTAAAHASSSAVTRCLASWTSALRQACRHPPGAGTAWCSCAPGLTYRRQLSPAAAAQGALLCQQPGLHGSARAESPWASQKALRPGWQLMRGTVCLAALGSPGLPSDVHAVSRWWVGPSVVVSCAGASRWLPRSRLGWRTSTRLVWRTWMCPLATCAARLPRAAALQAERAPLPLPAAPAPASAAAARPGHRHRPWQQADKRPGSHTWARRAAGPERPAAQVLLDAEGRAKLADTGLAVVLASASHRTEQSAPRGTFPYLAPELLMGAPEPVAPWAQRPAACAPVHLARPVAAAATAQRSALPDSMNMPTPCLPAGGRCGYASDRCSPPVLLHWHHLMSRAWSRAGRQGSLNLQAPGLGGL